MCRLEWLDSRQNNNFDVYVDEEYMQVWTIHEQVLTEEEILWSQKSQAKWLEFGD